MNLLTDPWVPVREGGIGALRQITFEELLCREGAWQVSLPRDDLEMACLQLLICLTQVMFMPADKTELRHRLKTPLSGECFAGGVKPYGEWFDLDHPQWPFMQTCGENSKWTSLQKLFPGLPEVTSDAPSAHCFFNETTEVRNICGAVAAIALFNQGSDAPGFGGGFKDGLRGKAPITTLVFGNTLRQTIWRNVMVRETVEKLLPGYDRSNDKPVWVEPIQPEQSIQESSIGLLRGLFWQPAHIALVCADEKAPCDVLGGVPQRVYSGFRKEKFRFNINGVWPHPHSALVVSVKKGKIEKKFASFTSTAPAWTQLSEFVVPRSTADGSEGQRPAASVIQFGEIFGDEPLHLLVGGYRARKASVAQRRHELFSIARGWAESSDQLKAFVNVGLEAKTLLRGKLYFAVQGYKNQGLKGIGAPIHKVGEAFFFNASEHLMHEHLRETDWRESARELERFVTDLGDLCNDIFNRLTGPYAHKPELIPIIARTRLELANEFHKMKEGVKQDAN